MNKKCLKCDKDFEAKKESAKFCSTSCRVMYNRKNPSSQKKKAELRMEVLYNSILDAIGKINTQNGLPQPMGGIVNTSNSIRQNKPIIRRSFENYRQLKLDCESAEAWEELKSEILASELSDKQKNLLLTA